MTPLRSRYTAALGAMLLGMLLVVSPVLEAFAGTCSRQAPDAADVSVVAVGGERSIGAGPSARLQDSCVDASSTYIAAVAVDSPRWGADVDAGPTRVGESSSRRPERARAARRPTAPDPVHPDTKLRSVVLQV